jgi:hypothetical protein
MMDSDSSQMAPDTHADTTATAIQSTLPVRHASNPDAIATTPTTADKTPSRRESWILSLIDAHASVFDVAVGIAGFGLGVCIWDSRLGAGFAFIGIGVSSWFSRKRASIHADLGARLSVPRNTFLDDMCDDQHLVPIGFGDHEHDGLLFCLRGLAEYGVLDVSHPLCPRCRQPLTQRACVAFPACAKIRFHCSCGFSASLPKTAQELCHEVWLAVRETARITRKSARTIG